MRAERVAAAILAAVLAAGGASALPLEGERLVLAAPDGWPALVARTPHRPLVPVVDGAVAALRFDGNSTYGESIAPVTVAPREGLTVSAWVALASPPVEAAAVVSIATEPGAPALRLAVGPWRQPEFVVGDLRAASFDALPLGRWVHLAGVVDADGARLYVDGERVAESPGTPPEAVSGGVSIGRDPFAGARDVHPYGIWNGLLGEIAVARGAAGPPTPRAAPADRAADVSVPPAWFAGRSLRPRVHPMPPAGWTNEPHALIRDGDVWRLYHQANPNGAFWDHIVWGHLVSDDLSRWEVRPPALLPSTGFDRRGVWVGNFVPDTEPPAILYTGVDGHRSGLGRAELQADGGFLRTEDTIAYDTPPGWQDMRDPYPVRTPDGWLALVGAGLPDDSRALILAFTSQDSVSWDFAGEFDTGDVAMPGQYWELPVLRRFGGRWLLMGTPVIRDAHARTLYWMGDFDGVRFTPARPEGIDYSLFGTMLAPTLADDGAGRTVAIGVIPDGGQRPEPARREAGWVHALSLPYTLSPCADDDRAICAALPETLVDAFPEPIASIEGAPLSAEGETIGSSDEPVLLRATLAIPRGGEAAIDVLATPGADDGAGERTRLRLRPAEGIVVLDRTRASTAPWAQNDARTGAIPAEEVVEIAIVVDGAAVSGTIGGRPFGVLVYPQDGDARRVVIAGEGVVRELTLSGRQ
ncbi:LamG-like jellyroll fold domain-containing protein [Salinarimonas chemoclinalis]|uniref:LamG-like jellyroll fold domain-containing protein n=1 Tax=Salinarimonas chemoclinalis TaxID=3241599 RepID=UPI003558AEBD